MAGTSGKPIVQKLGFKPGFSIFVDGLSVPYGDIVGELPADVRIAKTARAPLDAVHLFAAEAKGLAAKLQRYREAIAPRGMIWVSWPKKSSGVATDLDDRAVRETARVRSGRHQGLRRRCGVVGAEIRDPGQRARQALRSPRRRSPRAKRTSLGSAAIGRL